MSTQGVDNTQKIPIRNELQQQRWQLLGVRFFSEVLEACVILSVITIVQARPLDIATLLTNALLLGFVTMIMEMLNENYRTSIKNGMVFAIGNGLTQKS